MSPDAQPAAGEFSSRHDARVPHLLSLLTQHPTPSLDQPVAWSFPICAHVAPVLSTEQSHHFLTPRSIKSLPSLLCKIKRCVYCSISLLIVNTTRLFSRALPFTAVMADGISTLVPSCQVCL